jgi:uncharacterized SAM-binding protein YcdF (DUF218 family)
VFGALKPALLPPVGLLLPLILGLFLLPRWRRLGLAISGASALLLLVLALPVTGSLMSRGLEANLPRVPPPTDPPQAVVILSAEARAVDARRQRYEPGPLTWERLVPGTQLARQARLPILVTGGAMRPGAPSLAEVMARSAADTLGAPVRWIEPRARDTWENAAFSARILHDAGIRRVYLVSHAWHLRRAIAAFARFGIAATAVPVRPYVMHDAGWEDFLPSIAGWTASYHALHEWIGLFYYALR